MTSSQDKTRLPREIIRAKASAKSLRKALIAGDANAAARLRAVFGARRAPGTATHADCLHVIAHEAGAESWPKLKAAAEAAAMTRAERITALWRAVANGQDYRRDRLLALDPTLADAHFGLQLALVRTREALAALSADPALGVTPIADRLPVHYLCYSKYRVEDPGTNADRIALLDALVDAGADLDQGFPAEPGSDHRLSPLYGALGHAGNLPLAQALLERGADPNDNESLYHATELAGLEGVRLLFAHGASVGTTNAFYRMLDRESVEGVRLFLDNGADPNAPLYRHPTGVPADERNALHHAILRGRSGAIGALLIEHGADPEARFDGRSPYALAMACGNRSMAEMLAARGADTGLSDADRFMAHITAGEGPAARQLIVDHPGLYDQLTERDLDLQTELATQADRLPILRLLVELGFDPNRMGESDTPPIHAAAWWGHAEIVEMYLGLNVELESVNMFGGTALGTAIHGSMNCPGRADGDYLRCVRALVEAGARIRPDQGHLEMGTEDVTVYLEDQLEGAAPGPGRADRLKE